MTKKLECINCGYIWETRYNRIPARCPNCNGRIYGTENFKEKTCFIASAAYGTPFAEEIDVLRDWRDIYLLPTIYGRIFVSTYYKISPPIANFISLRNKLRAGIRKILNLYIIFLKKKM